MINALCVIDVVEGKARSRKIQCQSHDSLYLGSALESLSSMQCFLSSRPKQFSSPQQAIEYMVRSGQVRNVESARVSIIGQIQPISNINSTENSPSAIPAVSHLCEPVREEDEEEEEEEIDRAGEDHDHQVHHDEKTVHPPSSSTSAAEHSATSSSSMASSNNKYTWRIDLSKTEPFWQGWFSGRFLVNLHTKCIIFF